LLSKSTFKKIKGMRNILLTTFLVAVLSAPLSAQKTVNICGEFTYYAPENVTLEQAKRTALERAKLEALAKQFGTAIHSTAVLTKKEDGKNFDEQFFSLSASDVKGEWLETQGEPKYAVSYENSMLVVKVSVCGKAREIVSAGVDFSAKVLRNGTEAKHESDNFKHNDDIFLLFRSPTDGYLAVYLIDAEQTAFCLLPYMGDPTGKVKIKSGHDYIFFSEKHAAPAEKAMVTEYVLTCKEAVEQNFLYVIFSPNEFTKANDSQASRELALPRELPFEEFQKWLTKNRQRDKDLKVEIKSLTIKK
jgi:hypothetical protein